MTTIRNHTKTFAIVAVLCLGGALFLALPERAQSISYGAGNHSWLSTPHSRDNQAACTQSVPDATCKELCLLDSGNPVPTGTLCCLLPGQEECPANQTFIG